jgi:hypothetical protein
MQLRLYLLGAGNVLARVPKYKRAGENYLKAFDLSTYPVLFYSTAFIYTARSNLQIRAANIIDMYGPLQTILTAQNI